MAVSLEAVCVSESVPVFVTDICALGVSPFTAFLFQLFLLFKAYTNLHLFVVALCH